MNKVCSPNAPYPLPLKAHSLSWSLPTFIVISVGYTPLCFSGVTSKVAERTLASSGTSIPRVSLSIPAVSKVIIVCVPSLLNLFKNTESTVVGKNCRPVNIKNEVITKMNK